MKLEEIAENPSFLDESVITIIHDSDQMFTGSKERYFRCGKDAIKKICGIINTADSPPLTTILDFACGYGRVARYLRAAFPDVAITVSDVMEPAVAFCATTFSVYPHISSNNLDQVTITKGNTPQQFSLIWSGSLMTHFDEDQARNLIALFERHLNQDGLVIFTIHGRFMVNKYLDGSWIYKISENKMKSLYESFYQGQYSYKDYDHMKGYGISATSLAWLQEQITEFPSLRLVGLIERGWDNHQDIVALQKRAI